MFLEALVVSVLLVGIVELLSLPSYITPCSLSDPEFEKCAKSTAANFLKHAVNGDKDLKIPTLGHVKFPMVYFNNSKNVNFNISDCFALGLETTTFPSIKKIPDKNRIEFTFTVLLEVIGNFFINSKIGDVIIAGEGAGVLKFDKLVGDIGFDWKIIERDRVKYLDIVNVDVDLTTLNDTLVLDVDPDSNLNELLMQYGPQMFNEIRPRNRYYTNRVFSILTHVLFSSVPYNELFLE